MNDEKARSPAQVYEELFVPALFERWTHAVADTAQVGSGQRVLDVACGTGILARTAARRVGEDGSVIGIDPNPEMLEVARRVGSGIEWRQGQAESLPFPDAHFDAVVSQFGFMFFQDQPAAVSEMMRVLKPGGRLAVAVCDAIDHSPGYSVLAELLNRLFGGEVANSLRAPFTCGDPALLLDRFERAGACDAVVTRHDGYVRFSSVEALISTERACAWTLGGLLDDHQFDSLLQAAQESFAPFVTPDGSVRLLMPVLIASASKK